MILVLLINVIKSPDFFSIAIKNGVLYGRLVDILNRGSEIAILAVGQTLVVAVSAGTDISVGSVMDFMNLNQAAHGDREHGFIGARMRLARKIVVGYWEDTPVQKELGDWMRAAVGAVFSKELRLIRFGDNMRDVAVTEGDKVESEIKLGWQVDYWPVGHLVEVMDAVTETEIDEKLAEYRDRYDFATNDLDSVRYQAREELAIRKIMISFAS